MRRRRKMLARIAALKSLLRTAHLSNRNSKTETGLHSGDLDSSSPTHNQTNNTTPSPSLPPCLSSVRTGQEPMLAGWVYKQKWVALFPVSTVDLGWQGAPLSPQPAVKV
ncbi:hypothetical protein L209DRAFT_757262 [Thermothelomyces heterothallicus CBS 203.75]